MKIRILLRHKRRCEYEEREQNMFNDAH